MNKEFIHVIVLPNVDRIHEVLVAFLRTSEFWELVARRVRVQRLFRNHLHSWALEKIIAWPRPYAGSSQSS